MLELFRVLEQTASSDVTVLIQGETGTGKDLAARSIHDASTRADGPWMVVDCGAISPNLLESELFGHEKGAFTGADKPRAGVFESASGGTIFLDEIGELPLDLQPKLLRVLEQREVRRVGSSQVTPVDVRIIAATNRDLASEVKAGRFRQDLYYRLTVTEVMMPPLRERKQTPCSRFPSSWSSCTSISGRATAASSATISSVASRSSNTSRRRCSRKPIRRSTRTRST
jgi:transcriptional regulator with PAS, ATPase and Fis domain